MDARKVDLNPCLAEPLENDLHLIREKQLMRQQVFCPPKQGCQNEYLQKLNILPRWPMIKTTLGRTKTIFIFRRVRLQMSRSESLKPSKVICTIQVEQYMPLTWACPHPTHANLTDLQNPWIFLCIRINSELELEI